MRKYLFLIILIVLASSALAVIDSEINFEEKNEVPVIVILKETQTKNFALSSLEDKKSFLEQRRLEIAGKQDKVIGQLKSKGFAVAGQNQEKFRKFSTINAFAGTINQEEFYQLKNDPDVETIYLDKTFSVNLNDSTQLIKSASVNSLVQNYSFDLTGSGQAVCVIDTGIDYNHTALGSGWGNRVIAGYDFCGNGGGNIGSADCSSSDSDPYDNHGHGTHVAGIIGSSDSTYRGVAPSVSLVALKACDSDGDCSGSAMLSSIDWCNNNSALYNITVISMSIGDGGAYNASTCPTSFDSAISTAVSLGITFVVASGNEGYKTGISLPACSPNATSVGSVGKDDTIPTYSNSGILLDLLAPGGTSGSPIRSLNNGGGYADMYGTSMATPHVAGAVALLNQYKKLIQGTTYTPAEVETILKNTGVNKTDTNNITTPRIDVYSAILSVDNTAPAVSYISPTPGNNSQTSYSSVTVKINASETVNATLDFNGTNYSMSLVDNAVYQKTLSSLAKGSYSFMVYFSDLAGHSSTLGTYFVTLNNSAPAITSYTPNSTNVSVNEQSSLFFNQTSTDPENNTLTYAWYLNNSLQASTSYWNYTPGCSDAGNYSVDLIVSDGYINTTQTWYLLVNNTNCAPVASILSPSNNSVHEFGDSISFTTNSADPEGGNLTYLWNFGDSSNSTQANTTHTYASVNRYTLTLSVTSSSTNFSDSSSIFVNVTDTTAPTFNSVSYSNPIYSGDNLYITANITDHSTITNISLIYNSQTLSYSQSGSLYSWVISDPSNGAHSFLLSAKDIYDNQHNTTYDFTVDYCGDSTCQTAEESCSSCSSDCTCSSGGGGGGGGTAVAAVPEKTFVYSTVTAGSSYELVVNKEEIPFTILMLNPLVTKSNVQVVVSTTDAPPKTKSDVYKYLKIEMVNLVDAEVDASFIEFKIPKTWFTSNNYDQLKVTLYRYTSQWDSLTTVLSREDANYYYYQASTPGFSYFAIAAEKLPVPAVASSGSGSPPAPVPETFGVQEIGEVPIVTAQATSENQTNHKEQEGNNFNLWYLLMIIPALVTIALIVYFTRKIRPESEVSLGQKKGEILDHLVEQHEEGNPEENPENLT